MPNNFDHIEFGHTRIDGPRLTAECCERRPSVSLHAYPTNHLRGGFRYGHTSRSASQQATRKAPRLIAPNGFARSSAEALEHIGGRPRNSPSTARDTDLRPMGDHFRPVEKRAGVT